MESTTHFPNTTLDNDANHCGCERRPDRRSVSCPLGVTELNIKSPLEYKRSSCYSYLILSISITQMLLIVIYNPVSGDRTAAKLTTETILPLLASHDVAPDKVAATEHAGHAGTLLLSYIDSLSPS